MTNILSPAILILALLMVITGTINAIANKSQTHAGFNHPLMMTIEMFLGEYLNMLILVIPLMLSSAWRKSHFDEVRESAKKLQRSTSVGFFKLGLGGFLDTFGSGMQMLSIMLLPTSIWQMLRNGTVIFVVLFTIFYLKQKIPRHQWLAVGILMVGFLIVGYASSIKVKPDSLKEGEGNAILGVIILLISLGFIGFQFTYQEKLAMDYEFDPKRLIGAESVIGALSIFTLYFVTSAIKCPNEGLCGNNPTFDDPSVAMTQMLNNNTIKFWFIVIIFSIMIFNLTGLYLTKKVSSMFRIIVDSIRTILVWVISIYMGLEDFGWSRFYFQMPGFLLLVLGNLIFNEIIVIRFCGFDSELRSSKKETEENLQINE